MYIGEDELIKFCQLHCCDDISIDVTNEAGVTLLMYSSYCGNEELVASAIRLGADINIQNKLGETALMAASQQGHLGIVRKLLSYKAMKSRRSNDGTTALIAAVRNGHYSVAYELLICKANVNKADNNGMTALLFASKNNDFSIAEMLIAFKADVNHCNNNGETALMLAASLGHCDIVALLLKKNVRTELRDATGKTAFKSAVVNGHTEVAGLLMKHTQTTIIQKGGLDDIPELKLGIDSIEEGSQPTMEKTFTMKVYSWLFQKKKPPKTQYMQFIGKLRKLNKVIKRENIPFVFSCSVFCLGELVKPVMSREFAVNDAIAKRFDNDRVYFEIAVYLYARFLFIHETVRLKKNEEDELFELIAKCFKDCFKFKENIKHLVFDRMIYYIPLLKDNNSERLVECFTRFIMLGKFGGTPEYFNGKPLEDGASDDILLLTVEKAFVKKMIEVINTKVVNNKMKMMIYDYIKVQDKFGKA